MKQKLEVVTEIQKLFCEEAASIDHSLTPSEAFEREQRLRRLGVLFQILQSAPYSSEYISVSADSRLI